MIRSMTGYGRWESADENRKFTVEIKSVNHRYFDVNIRMPKKLLAFESAVRNILKQQVDRGKIDVYINYEDSSAGSEALTYNQEIAGEYVAYFAKMQETFGLENDMTVSKLARCPEVLTMAEKEDDQEEVWKLLEEAVQGAVGQFVDSRTAEGQRLMQDLLTKLVTVESCVDQIEQHSPGLVEQYRQKLLAKVQEVLADTKLDESRIATEVTIYADKICVDEETVRLRSHVESMRNVLKAGGAAGKKLDFIAQEMNREANTILSKANDLELTNIAITLKTEIEKVREQIQNLE